ncbi:MAG: thioredoxin fold domain-containing protein [Desulforhopalus sp.]|nr:thioredoxin fold domain-containing protein [Desulforhopalus sp.]
MEINKIKIKFICFGILSLLLFLVPQAFSASHSEIPVKGMTSMVDLGAKKCIPCKMMAPILEKLTKQYEGSAAIIFIDVWEDNSQARKFGVRSIPTQIFYDKNGQEVYRHQGFLAEDAIIKQLAKMGVTAPEGD